jgi:transposase
MDGITGLEPGVTEATAVPATQNAGSGDAVAGRQMRFSATRKLTVVERLLQVGPLEKVSRETNVLVHRSSEWRDRVLLAVDSALR